MYIKAREAECRAGMECTERGFLQRDNSVEMQLQSVSTATVKSLHPVKRLFQKISTANQTAQKQTAQKRANMR